MSLGSPDSSGLHSDNQGSENSRPLVSVILPVYNEAAHIEKVVLSILNQLHSDFDLEIMVIDGKSTDGTLDKLQQLAGENPAVRLLVNERRRTPFAFNLGLKHARGEYVCIFGAHTAYEPDYIATCLRELKAHGAAGCGGRVITTPANQSLQARLVAACVGHPFGTSSKSFRNHPEGFADTVNYPVYLRSALMEINGYDEELYRNQDNDLNQRLRARGHRLFVTWQTSCRYFVQPSIRLLMKYAWHTGFWNAISLKKNASAHALYHFVPAIFVLAGVVASLAAILGRYSQYRLWASLPLGMLLAMYVGVALPAAVLVAARQKWWGALLLPLVFLSLHVSYGLATLWALVSNAKSPEAERVQIPLEQTNQGAG